MSIPVQCPACHHAFAVADRFAGKKGKCPKCGMIFRADPTPAPDIDVFPEVPLAPAAATPAVPRPKRLVAGADSARLQRAAAREMTTDSGPVETFANIPVGTPVGTPAPAAPAPFVPSDSGETSVLHRRRKQASLPLIIGGGLAALAAVGITIGIVIAMRGSSAPAVAQKTDEVEAADDDPATDENADTPAAAPGPADPPPIAPAAIDTASIAPLRANLLNLEITTLDGTSQAQAFLAGSMLAVAPLHAVEKATDVVATTADGQRVPVAGLAGTDPVHNLALLKLEPTAPLRLVQLPVSATAPAEALPVAALAQADATPPVVTGEIKKATIAAALAPSLRIIARRLTDRWDDDTVLVQHTVALPDSASGTPLFNASGQVVAIHLFYGELSGGLALDARYIADVAAKATSDITPFNPMAIARAAPGLKSPATPDTNETPDDPVADLLERIEDHHLECKLEHWAPSDATEYAQFQLLARFLNEAAQQADAADTPAEVKEKLLNATREVMFSIKAEDWPSDTAWQATGKLAEEGLKTPGEGFYALAKVVMAPSNQQFQNQPFALLEIIGTSQLILLPVAKEPERLKVDTHLLIFGVHENVSISINNGERMAALIRCKFALSAAKQD